ncbi:hypothetical protein CKO15_11595 [Halorhodospira abdelmalekii]|uniref:diguanylate cyclase n=1 Tax=Halorhodospira abdelmalekii TaxID=421629 RepID=UPI0019055359|nr:diguanylate cyclase [Halorhodospira abdelmalekii]MBK1735909.1 hypothetical protein [Halorhodospira abdelmalekii]
MSRAYPGLLEQALASDITALLVLDADGDLVYANTLACRLLDLPIQGSASDGSIDCPLATDQLPSELSSFRWLAQTATPLRDVRLTLQRANGEQRVLSVNAAPLHAQPHSQRCIALAVHDFTEQYHYYEETLREHQQRLKLATESAGLGIWERDLATDTFHWDDRMLDIYGLPPSSPPRNYAEWRVRVEPADLPAVERAFSHARVTHSRWEIEFRIRRPDGEIRHLRGFGQYIYNRHGHAVRIVGINEDITVRKQVESELALSKSRLEEAQRIARLGHWVVYPHDSLAGGQLWWSPVIYEIFGRNPRHYAPSLRRFLEAVHPEDRPFVREDVIKRLPEYQHHQIEYRIVRPNGAVRWVRTITRTERDANAGTWRIIGTLQDITEQKELQQELEYRASHDPLTDLFNRAKLQQHLRAANAAYNRHGTLFAVVIIDIDHFKSINDRWGHAAGDAVLWEIGRRMSAELRETDVLGRWGGEEFLILATHTDEAGTALLAERIREAISATAVQGIGTITASFGVAAIEPGLSLESLENRADQAMYAAKKGGRNLVVRYSELTV